MTKRHGTWHLVLLALLILGGAALAAPALGGTPGKIFGWGSDEYGQVSQIPEGAGFTAIAAGYVASHALRTDGSIASWGDDRYGQVSQTPTGLGFTAIAAGGSHSLALRTDGSIVSWGDDRNGQVSRTPQGTGFTAIAAGSGVSHALRADGSIVSWGSDLYSQVSQTPLGTGFTTIAAGSIASHALRADGSIASWGMGWLEQLKQTPQGTGFTAITAGGVTSHALRADGTIVGWGEDPHNLVSQTPSGTGYSAIAEGLDNCLALRADGSIAAWGDDTNGVVSQTPQGTGFIAIAITLRAGCALRPDTTSPALGGTPGSVVAWGWDSSGQVSETPAGSGFTAIAAGWKHSLALNADGSIVSWGNDGFGQVSETPAGPGYRAIDAGGSHSLALKADGSIVSWGWDDDDQVSDTPAGTGYTAIAGGDLHSLALRMDGSVVSWGSDYFGQVSQTPVGTGYTAIAAGGHHNLALRADGSIAAWGWDADDQVSDTPAGTGYTAIAAGYYHNLALKADGSIAAWGYDYSGQVSDTPAGTGYTAIAAGKDHSFALRTDGSIVSWGLDEFGQVSQTPAGTGYTAIAGGFLHSLAIDSRCIAAFTATPQRGAAPLEVQFTDTSTGGATSWSWNFGDGATGSGQTTSRIYHDPGTYTVTLTVGRGAESFSTTKTIIVDYPPPSIDLETFVSVDGGATWHDADTAPGPSANAGSPVQWKYVVTNLGGMDLSSIQLTGVLGAPVTLPKTSLAYRESTIATASSMAVAGQFDGSAIVSGQWPFFQIGGGAVWFTVTDSDDVHYNGIGIADRAPALDEIPAHSVGEGDTLGFTVHATDPDGDPVTYAVSGLPENAGVELDPTTGAFLWSPGFDRAGTYSATFTATSGTGEGALSDSRTVTITVTNVNRAPVAYAGPDQVLEVPGATVTLDGSGSYDEDGDPLAYAWTLRRPSGSTAVLAGGTSASPTFVADRVGEYTVELVVSDGTASSAVDAVTLSFANLRPVADAGLSQSAILGELVSLDGSGSYDLNKGDTLTYGWSVASAPAGSAAQIGNPAAMSTAFVPDRVGSYRIQLVVSDGQLSSEPSFCEIAVVTRETQIVTDIQDAEASIASLDPVVFDNPSMQNALINKLNAVLADIGSMDPQEAINKLRNDILAKTDGCVLTGAPDKNDWIEDCSTQQALYAQVQAIIDAVSLL